MGRWLLLLVLIFIAFGVWVTVDPGARPAIATAWNRTTAASGGDFNDIDAASLWAPIGRAFQDFANSVSSMWSPKTIRMDMPSVQIQP